MKYEGIPQGGARWGARLERALGGGSPRREHAQHANLLQMGTTAAESAPTPSPAPASEVRPASDAIDHALAHTDLDGARRAHALYGHDDDRELNALVDGTHPFQRTLDTEALAASRREAAELLAALA